MRKRITTNAPALARIRQTHVAQPRPIPNAHQPYCVACGENYPCGTILLADAVEAAQGYVDENGRYAEEGTPLFRLRAALAKLA